VVLGRGVRIGPGCEVKSSLVLSGTTLAHFNFVGDSIIGRDVNLEAGAVLANHWNERRDKAITVAIAGRRLVTGAVKFGAVIGDRCRIGANAVLAPGTLLPPDTVVARLQLVDQSPAAR
jgi:NDP-sugar pyrophosphorylase family protein